MIITMTKTMARLASRAVSEKVDILCGEFRARGNFGVESRRKEYIRKPKLG